MQAAKSGAFHHVVMPSLAVPGEALAQPGAGHPRLSLMSPASKTWMAGT
jgi:hypothetical protein